MSNASGKDVGVDGEVRAHNLVVLVNPRLVVAILAVLAVLRRIEQRVAIKPALDRLVVLPDLRGPQIEFLGSDRLVADDLLANLGESYICKVAVRHPT